MTDDRLSRLTSDLTRLGDDRSRSAANRSTPVYPAFVGRVVGNPLVGTGAGRYVSVHPVSVLGNEAEGGTGVLIEDTSTSILVYALGPRAPKAGDDLVCRFIENRWVALSGGKAQAAQGQIRGCTCATPPISLRMSVSRQGCSDGLLNSCTISYRPTPASLASLHLGDSCYLSTELFTDTQTGDQFYYFLGCFASIFRVSRVFPSSVFGSPFLDSVIYYWSVGLAGNTCQPFLLSNGQIYFGGDPSCLVTISE
jgi:hypothetical protein